MTSGTADAASFEEAVGRLEEIVISLETGALPLGESLRRFEEAISLSRLCAAQLQDAEAKITVLTTTAPAVTETVRPTQSVSLNEPAVSVRTQSPSAGWDPFAEE